MKRLNPILIALFCTLGATTSAQPGNLDESFGTNGKVTTAFGTGADLGNSIAIQPDGKIVVAGQSGSDFGLARFNTDGTLDSSFGVAGKVTTAFGTGPAHGLSVAIQPDGKIIVAGSVSIGTELDFALARYNTDGALDNSFGLDGKVTTAFGTGHDSGRSVAIQLDGKILMAGYLDLGGFNHDFALARYNTDGTLDNSFGVDGKVTTAFGTGHDFVESVAIQPDGKAVVAGSTNNSTGDEFALARYNTDGSLDNSFGVDGKVTTDFGAGGAGGNSVGIQPNGKIVVAGNSNGDFAIARYNTDGTLDTSFGVGGIVTTGFGTTDDRGSSVAIQPDGKIAVAGKSYTGTEYEFALARYNTDGTLDNSFSLDGKVTTDFGMGSSDGRSVAIQPDGRIVVAGIAISASGVVFAVARYLSGLGIGIIDLSIAHGAPLIYPNPIAGPALLEYTLLKDETVSIRLLDLQGRTVQTFIENKRQIAGPHQQVIELPEALPSGTYLIKIASANGSIAVQVVK